MDLKRKSQDKRPPPLAGSVVHLRETEESGSHLIKRHSMACVSGEVPSIMPKVKDDRFLQPHTPCSRFLAKHFHSELRCVTAMDPGAPLKQLHVNSPRSAISPYCFGTVSDPMTPRSMANLVTPMLSQAIGFPELPDTPRKLHDNSFNFVNPVIPFQLPPGTPMSPFIYTPDFLAHLSFH